MFRVFVYVLDASQSPLNTVPAPGGPATVESAPSIFCVKIVDADHVIPTLVSDGDPLIRAVHEYTVS